MKLKLKIINLEGVYFDGEVDLLNITIASGNVTILANHLPLISNIEISHMYTKNNGVIENYAIADGKGGFLTLWSDEHTEYETLKIDDLNYTLERVRTMLDSANEAEMFNFESIHNNKLSLYGKCQFCGNIVPYFEIIPIEGVSICLECLNAIESWCDSSSEQLLSEEVVGGEI